MFFKRLKAYRFQYIVRTLLFFASFLILLLYSSVCFSFYQSVFLYSGGYQDGYAYADTLYADDIEALPEDRLYYAFGIRPEYKGDTMEITGYCSGNILESKGFFLYPRAFVSYDRSDFRLSADTLPEKYCLTTEEGADTVLFEGNEYPVAGTFSISLSQAVENNYSLLGVRRVRLNLVVDPSVSPEQTQNCFMICSDSSLVGGRTYFASGRELNRQYREGYSLYLPLIYLLFLIPLSVYLIALTSSLRQVCSFEMRESFLLRCTGLSEGRQFRSLFGGRLLSLVLTFVCSLLFLPLAGLPNRDFYRLAFPMLAVNFLLLFFGILFLTLQDLNRVYKGKISFLENHND